MAHLFPEGAKLGSDNVVLHASARRHVVTDLAGPLSVKTVVRGQVSWTVGGRELVLDPSSFLVLADGERYSMNIDERRAVETCCVFFRRGFVESLAQDATTPLDASLDDPMRGAPALPFLSRMHLAGGESCLHAQVQTLAPRCSQMLQPSGFEEDFLLLGERLLALYAQIAAEVRRVPAVKAATREELFRRLQIAREYIHGHVGQALSLEETSRAACLSPYHFHRAFRQVYGATPHEYMTGLRLQRARVLICDGNGVLEAGVAVGFSSASSFSRLFRERFGVPPSKFRKIRQASLSVQP